MQQSWPVPRGYRKPNSPGVQVYLSGLFFLHQSHHAINSITGGIDISTNTWVYNIASGVEIYVRGVFSKLPSLFILTRPKLVGVPHGSEITDILIGEVVVNGNHLCTIAIQRNHKILNNYQLAYYLYFRSRWKLQKYKWI